MEICRLKLHLPFFISAMEEKGNMLYERCYCSHRLTENYHQTAPNNKVSDQLVILAELIKEQDTFQSCWRLKHMQKGSEFWAWIQQACTQLYTDCNVAFYLLISLNKYDNVNVFPKVASCNITVLTSQLLTASICCSVLRKAAFQSFMLKIAV